MPETTKTIRPNTHPSRQSSAKSALRPLAAALFALLSFPALTHADPAETPSSAETQSEPAVDRQTSPSASHQPLPQGPVDEPAVVRDRREDFRNAAFAPGADAPEETDESLFREADDVMPLRLTVPPLRPSRIDFPDERILSVVVDSSHVEVLGESDRSDFFLRPKHPGSTTLFVTLARGETVPVEVTVREDAKPRNVVLHLKDREAKPAANLRADLPAMKSVPYADLFTGLLTDLENGRTSRGVMTVASGPEAPLTPAARTVVS